MNRTVAFSTVILPQRNWSLPYHLLRCQNTTDLTIFLATSYSLETVLGILGNTCLMGILARQKEKATATNVLITNLIASELLMCIFCLPFTVVTILLNYWVFGAAMCKMTNFIQCTSMTVSILSLVLIAVERHQLILNPTGWRPGFSQAYQGIAATWIFASLLSLPFVTNSTLRVGAFKWYAGIVDTYADKAICTCLWSSEEYRLAYATVLMLLQYCVPLAAILVCYLRIYLRLQKRKGMFEKSEPSRRTIHLTHINLLLAVMVAAFAICWLPLHVFNGINDWDYKLISHCLHDLIFSLCHLTGMASACVNPIIYGFLNKNFKKEVKALLLSCRRRPSEQEYEHLPLPTVQTEASRASLKLSGQQDPI
ncbi:PREDICTED: neuropeptide Y receptor type 4-like [Gekko japonicus]|uniref:Neuropeptide Y receptor type 4-like n=1 Tax=Gekko japonicus TaxID=146911 RepID=A0ABM1K293_GEKJA|nr:PREDICTED: neuropeptide Y receptor type 4-like [Gekko japonicus]XP_015284158.1 PREDICTED: neuropeptide Y receptor type 4-like [Gekko japonicus]